jgi:uncharacterized membrane protein YkoI
MNKKTKLMLGGVAALLVIGVATGAGIAAQDDDTPLTGSNYDRATEAALEHTGGGTVLETEMGDGGAAYEVEIRREDGTAVEVGLNRDFEVIGSERDDDSAEESGSDD